MPNVIQRSEYKGVSKIVRKSSSKPWIARLKHDNIERQEYCSSEREAAIAYDKMRIKVGKDPVNILKRKG